MAKKHNITLLRSKEATSSIVSSIITYLNAAMAPRITRHGVLMEVHGEGILLIGESGIGKSEAAMELIKRGHRLIADDAVEIRKISGTILVGTAPELIRNYIERRDRCAPAVWHGRGQIGQEDRHGGQYRTLEYPGGV